MGVSMLSPASHHRSHTSAGQAVKPASAGTPPGNPEAVIPSTHESVIVAQFKADQDSMSHIKSRTRRTEAKRHALARYQQWLDVFPDKRTFEKHDERMFVWLLLWHIDVGDWQRSLELARFALPSGMLSPLDFSRTLPETVAEELAGGILNTGKPEHHADVLDQLAQLLDGYDMIDQISAKLYKARGLARLDSDPDQARELLGNALALDPKSGVKRHLQALDGTGKHKARAAVVNINDYSLSARQAAKLANMTAPAFLRHAKKHPDLLPRVEIPLGKRHLYRFNPTHVKAYLKKHLVKTTCNQ